MRGRLIVRLVVIGLIGVFLAWLVRRLQGVDPGTTFVIVLFVGAGLGVLAAKVILPRIGDAVGAFFYAPGGVLITDEATKGAVKLAQGDYAGAIAEYEAELKQKPDDTLAIGEIAKIHAERLNDPETALSFLRAQLASRSWPPDEAAFLMFRIAGIRADVMKDFAGAQAALEQVIATFPDTRHSANARHKLKELAIQRLKAGSERPS